MIETCSKVSSLTGAAICFRFLIALQGSQANCGSRTKVQQGQTIRRFCYKPFLKLLVYASFDHKCVQLFQLTLSVQSMKLKDKTESLRGIFMNKFIKISHAWRKQ